jgi:hypothetical protein
MVQLPTIPWVSSVERREQAEGEGRLKPRLVLFKPDQHTNWINDVFWTFDDSEIITYILSSSVCSLDAAAPATRLWHAHGM